MKRSTYPNLRLWLLLAMVPIAIVGAVYLYGSSNFDSSIIKESDMDVDGANQMDNFEIEERKVDVAERVNQKMVLPQTKTKPVQTTTKQDKRMLDETGNMITFEVKVGDTLESIAKSELGDEAFWVFIFEVNRDKLNKTTDLAVGMKLYIPNPEFFGFNAKDQSTIQYAKQKAEDILSKQN